MGDPPRSILVWGAKISDIRAAPSCTGPALAPAPHQGVTETYRMRISFHSSSELPICFPVFLVSLGSPSPATST